MHLSHSSQAPTDEVLVCGAEAVRLKNAALQMGAFSLLGTPLVVRQIAETTLRLRRLPPEP
jgi:hypothetical protein